MKIFSDDSYKKSFNVYPKQVLTHHWKVDLGLQQVLVTPRDISKASPTRDLKLLACPYVWNFQSASCICLFGIIKVMPPWAQYCKVTAVWIYSRTAVLVYLSMAVSSPTVNTRQLGARSLKKHMQHTFNIHIPSSSCLTVTFSSSRTIRFVFQAQPVSQAAQEQTQAEHLSLSHFLACSLSPPTHSSRPLCQAGCIKNKWMLALLS